MAKTTAERPWTPSRIARVRKAINAAFDDAERWIGSIPDWDEMDALEKRLKRERTEALALVDAFRAVAKKEASHG